MTATLTFVVLASVLIGGCGKRATASDAGDNAQKPVVQITLVKPTRQTLSKELSVTGTVSPLANHESKVAPLMPGKIQALPVKVGQSIMKGQIIAQLDPGPMNGQIQQAQATVSSDVAALSQAKINYDAQVSSQRSGVAQAEQNLKAQQVALAKLKAGARPQEIAQAQSAVTAAQAALTNARQNLSRSQTLYTEGLLAKKDLEAAQSTETSASAQLQSAQEVLSLTKEGNRPQDIQAAQIAVEQAEQQLSAAKAGVLQTQSKAEDVQIAERALENAKGALQAIMAQKAGLTILAPLSGIITARPLNVGEWVDTSGSVATIADLATVRLMLQVPASQADEVRPGMDVQFSVDSAPNVQRHATVSVVGKAMDPTTNAVTVEAIAPNPNLAIQDDAFVHAHIILGRHLDVLTVPASALVQKDGKMVVFVVGADNIAHEKDVTVGLQQQDLAEVSGINANDSVVTSGAYELDDGTQVKTSS